MVSRQTLEAVELIRWTSAVEQPTGPKVSEPSTELSLCFSAKIVLLPNHQGGHFGLSDVNGGLGSPQG